MSIIHPVILAGGSGTRLWPLSRAAFPKQLLGLMATQTMLQATLARAANIPGVAPAILIANEEHRFLIREQLAACGYVPASIYLEPAGRNTAAAIALAALHLAQTDPDAVMLVLPADHVIDDTALFNLAVHDALAAALAGHLVTFGIVPNAPETGFGYILTGQRLPIDGAHADIFQVAAFVEKPDRPRAEQLLAEGDCYWNSGMFVFRAKRYLEELAAYRPDILQAVTQAWQGRRDDLEFCRPDQAAFLACPSESVDYAVMQATSRAAVVPAQFGWSDIGSWDALWKISAKDSQGNVSRGDTYLANTQNSYVRAESRLVAVLGMDDVVVVETADAVLVMRRSDAQNLKSLVQHLEFSGRSEHAEQLRVYRPWGWYEGVDRGERFQVKRIMVKPGGKLSLQMHQHRAEHWVVVSGIAKVWLNGEESTLNTDQSTYIPLGQQHRLENPGDAELHIIEVQSGNYLGEDDIIRYEDSYGRMST